MDSAPKRSYHCYFHYAREFDTPVLAHLLDSLVRVSRRGKEIHFANITSSYETSLSPSQDKKKQANSCKIVSPETNPCWPTPSHSVPVASNRENMTEQDTGFLRFPFSNFRYSLTLFSKFFASFPHGTCTLSVSHQYLALDGIYHPLRAAIPNNSTRRHQTQKAEQTGVSPSKLPCSKGLGSAS